MDPGPSKIVEAIVGFFIPPACRESVLGDLRERFGSARQYKLEAIRTVPMVILSRIRRTTDPQVLLMEAFAIYVSFVGVVWGFGDMSFLERQQGYLRLAIPTAVTVLALVLLDAYANPAKKSPLRPIWQAAFGVGMAFISQATLVLGDRDLAVPDMMMLYGGGIGLLLISVIRMIFMGEWPRLT